MNKKVIASVIGSVAVIGLATGIVVANQSPKLIKDKVTIEAGDEFNPKAEDYFKGNGISNIEFRTSTVDTSKVGEYDLVAGYKRRDYAIAVIVEDTKAPTIKVVSEEPIYTNDVNAVVPKECATVSDVTECTVEFTGFQKLEALDAEPTTTKEKATPTEEGIYCVTVTATDEGENTAETTITVVYDKTAPTIEGLANSTVEAAPTVESITATATDAIDGAVEVSKTVEQSADGTYTVTATAKDKAGNEATATAVYTVAQQQASTTSKPASNGSNSKPASGNKAPANSGNNNTSGSSSGGTTPPASGTTDTGTTDGYLGSGPIYGDSYRDENGILWKWDAFEFGGGQYNRVWEDDWICKFPGCDYNFGKGDAGKAAFEAHMKEMHGW